MLYKVRECFGYTGFPDQAKKYVQEYLDQTKDSVRYLCYMAWEEHKTENFQGGLNYMLKGLQLDSTFRSFLIGTTIYYIYLNDYAKAYEYSKKVEKLEKELNGSLFPFTRGILGYIYLKIGKQEEAEYHLKEAIKYYLEETEINRAISRKTFDFFYLSGIYAALGDKENALKYVKMLKEMEVIRGEYVLDLKFWPWFDIIREEPEFKDILKDAESKYQREHERVKKLLIREGIIET
jgi:tetratricopeptide (TPR) repeat protein